MHASWLSLYQPVGIRTGLTEATKLTGGFAVQVGRYGGLEEEVEHLKRDKNVLMLELVRLRQQQQVNPGRAVAEGHMSCDTDKWWTISIVASIRHFQKQAFHAHMTGLWNWDNVCCALLSLYFDPQ
jgi:hypothetical protein